MGNSSNKENQKQKNWKVSLRKGITNQEKQYIYINKYITDLYENQTWHIDFKKYNYFYALSLVGSPFNVKTLSVNLQSSPLFLYKILDLKFVNVKKLTLNNNKIVSIDILTYTYFPELQQIFLQQNLISNIKNLRKICRNVKVLGLRQNIILNLQDQKFEQISFSKDVDSLNIQTKNQFHYGNDARWLIKLPIKNVARLQINSKCRIGIKKQLLKMIKQMYGQESQLFFYIKTFN